MKFHVPDMSCAHCVATIEKAMVAADPTASVRADLNSRTTDFSTALSGDEIMQILAKAGYTATPSDNDGRACTIPPIPPSSIG